MTRATRPVQVVLSAVVLCALWQIVGQLGLLGPSFPALTTVAGLFLSPARTPLLLDAIAATSASAVAGLTIGAAIGMSIAGVRQALPVTRMGLDRLAALMHAVPQIAIAPVMIIVFGREGAPIAVASVASFFFVYAGSTVAFATATQTHQDLFSVLGSKRADRFLRLEVPAATPGLADALKLAAPSAVLGAVIGEWFGAPRGVGLLILSSAYNYDIPLLWAAAILSALMAMVGFALFAAIQHVAARRLT